MDLSAINLDLSALSGSNFTIIIGVFVTLVVMGITTSYDKYKSKDRTSAETRELKPFLNLNQKIKDFGLKDSSSKYMSSFSEFSKKLSNLIPKKVKKYDLENSETKPLKLTSGIPKIFGTIKSKISSFSFTLRGKKDKLNSKKEFLQSSKRAETSKFSRNEKVSGFDIDKIVESKQDELDFDDSVLTEMSTSRSSKKNNKASLDTDLEFDKNEFDIGFGAMNDESSEEDLLFNTGSEKIDLADEHDNLLDSLKKDIVVKSEKKINFMSEMGGQNLDLKLIKSDLQDILNRLKKYRQHSNHN